MSAVAIGLVSYGAMAIGAVVLGGFAFGIWADGPLLMWAFAIPTIISVFVQASTVALKQRRKQKTN